MLQELRYQRVNKWIGRKNLRSWTEQLSLVRQRPDKSEKNENLSEQIQKCRDIVQQNVLLKI